MQDLGFTVRSLRGLVDSTNGLICVVVPSNLNTRYLTQKVVSPFVKRLSVAFTTA